MRACLRRCTALSQTTRRRSAGRELMSAAVGGLPAKQQPPRSQSSLSSLLDRRWLLPDARIRLDKLQSAAEAEFWVLRDDLLHPFLGGNKLRKLDGIAASWRDAGVSDVVTCGGVQSAHASAIAAVCAEQGIRSHLNLRGEAPDVPTGNTLIVRAHPHGSLCSPCACRRERSRVASRLSPAGDAGVPAGPPPPLPLIAPVPSHGPCGAQSAMFATTITWVPRGDYADRERMLSASVDRVLASHGASTSGRPPAASQQQVSPAPRVVAIPEGAATAEALLGLVRLVHSLATAPALKASSGGPVTVVIDSGTGATAAGVALGCVLAGLPWKVVGVVLAGTADDYAETAAELMQTWRDTFGDEFSAAPESLPLYWAERDRPRRFGKVFDGEITACREVAQARGVLLDPIYTLAAWEASQALLSGCELSCSRDAGAAPPQGGGGVPQGPAAVDEPGGGGGAESSNGQVVATTAGSRRPPQRRRRLQRYKVVAAAVRADEAGGAAGDASDASPGTPGRLAAAGGEAAAVASSPLVGAGPPRVLMLHTGGTLGLFGLAQSSKKHAGEILAGGGGRSNTAAV